MLESGQRETLVDMMTSLATKDVLTDSSDSPDPDFSRLAAEASHAAIERAFAASLSVTFMENGRFYRRFPDERIVEIPADEVKAIREGRPWP